MKRRWVVTVLVGASVLIGAGAWAQSGRTSGMEGPQPSAAPGTRMGPEMRQGAYDPDAAHSHLGDMMLHLGAMLNRLGRATMDGKLSMGPGGGEATRLLEQAGALTQRMARILAEGRFSRKAMMEMADQMAAMQEAMKRIPELAQLPPR